MAEEARREGDEPKPLAGTIGARSRVTGTLTVTEAPLTRTEAHERGIPAGYRWDEDYTVPLGADGHRQGRVVKVTGEFLKAQRRDEWRRQAIADAPRLVPEQRPTPEVAPGLLTSTEARERGCPPGHAWEPDPDAPPGPDGRPRGRHVPITAEFVEAQCRLEEQRRMSADSPPGPRYVPESRPPAQTPMPPRQAAPRTSAPRRSNGQGGRPGARSSRSTSSSGEDDPDADAPGEAGHQLALAGHAELDDALTGALHRDRDTCKVCDRPWSWLVRRDPNRPSMCDGCTEAAA